MAQTDAAYRVTIEATFNDKVRAIRGLLNHYRRSLPERFAEIERAAVRPEEPTPDEPTTAASNP